MSETNRITPQDVIQQAVDVVFNVFTQEMQHAAGCGCPGCMSQGRASYDWFNGENNLTPQQKNETIQGLAAVARGGMLLGLTKRFEAQPKQDTSLPPQE